MRRIRQGPARRRWARALQVAAGAFVPGAIVAPVLVFSFPPEPEVRVGGWLVTGTSHFAGPPDDCNHVFSIRDPSGLVERIEWPACTTPPGFHRASGLHLVVEGARRDGTVIASDVFIDPGGCCGGPHCYP